MKQSSLSWPLRQTTQEEFHPVIHPLSVLFIGSTTRNMTPDARNDLDKTVLQALDLPVAYVGPEILIHFAGHEENFCFDALECILEIPTFGAARNITPLPHAQQGQQIVGSPAFVALDICDIVPVAQLLEAHFLVAFLVEPFCTC